MQTPPPLPPERGLSDLAPLIPDPGFSRTPPPAELPGFDPSNSPLSRGGRDDAPEPIPADATLVGLTNPRQAGQVRVIYRVRREGWVARRSAARSRFGRLSRTGSSSIPRVLAGLDERRQGGVLRRSRSKAVRPRFNLRGL